MNSASELLLFNSILMNRARVAGLTVDVEKTVNMSGESASGGSEKNGIIAQNQKRKREFRIERERQR